MTTVKICLGSSCFARGNGEILSFIKKYINDNAKQAEIQLIGCRCGNLCADGPNIFIDDKKYSQVTLTELPNILEHL